MYHHPLTGAVAKFNRANFHAHELRERLGREPYGIDALHELDPRASEYVLNLEWDLIFPWFPVIFGDAVHNWRSSLDHLFCGLIVMDGRRIRGHEQFPICTVDPNAPGADPEFTKRYRWLLGRIPSAQAAIIDGLQPFRHPNPKSDDLAVLNRLDNDDKHSQLTPHLIVPMNFQVSAATIADCRILEVRPAVGTELKLGAEIGRILYVVDGKHPQISVKGRLTPEIRLSKTGDEVFGFIARLQKIIHFELFEPLIPNLVKIDGALFVDPPPGVSPAVS